MLEIVKVFFDCITSLGYDFLFLTLILGILCVVITIYYPKFRGYMGEFWVRKELEKLPKDKYVVLNDIMLMIDNKTTQIDHIVVSKFGIFVIEMKNYFGFITGDEYVKEWIQYLGKNKYYFNNPIHQNYGHIQTLKKVLNVDERYFISVVCISNQAKIKVKSKSLVVQVENLVSEIYKYSKIIVDNEIDFIANIISKKNIVDVEMRKKHIIDIKNKIRDDRNKIVNNICPWCGGYLLERKSKYGVFIGCSNYPNCKYLKK